MVVWARKRGDVHVERSAAREIIVAEAVCIEPPHPVPSPWIELVVTAKAFFEPVLLCEVSDIHVQVTVAVHLPRASSKPELG